MVWSGQGKRLSGGSEMKKFRNSDLEVRQGKGNGVGEKRSLQRKQEGRESFESRKQVLFALHKQTREKEDSDRSRSD